MIEQLPGSWWLLIVLGLGTGMLCGLLGLGGGIVMIPLLVMWFSLPQKTAQGAALAVMAPMALFAACSYWRQGNLNLHGAVLMLLIAGALAGVMIGAGLMHRIPGDLLRKLFAVLLVGIGLKMLFTADPAQVVNESREAEQRGAPKE